MAINAIMAADTNQNSHPVPLWPVASDARVCPWIPIPEPIVQMCLLSLHYHNYKSMFCNPSPQYGTTAKELVNMIEIPKFVMQADEGVMEEYAELSIKSQ